MFKRFNKIKALLIACFFSCLLAQVQSTTMFNYAEFGSVGAAFTAEMLARNMSKDGEDVDSKRVALLNAISTAFSVVNKSLSLYNGVKAPNKAVLFDIKNRNLCVNALLLLGELTRLCKNANTYRLARLNEQKQNRQELLSLLEQTDSDSVGEVTNSDESLSEKFNSPDDCKKEDGDEQKNYYEICNNETFDLVKVGIENAKSKSKTTILAYQIGMPTLKALANVAVAYAQEGISRYSGTRVSPKFRNFIALVQTFVYLLDLFLEVGGETAAYKTVICAALVLNIFWIVYEVALFRTPDVTWGWNSTNCGLENIYHFGYSTDENGVFKLTECGHCFCKTCFESYYIDHICKEQGYNLDLVKCTACQAEDAKKGVFNTKSLNKDEIRQVLGDGFIEKCKKADEEHKYKCKIEEEEKEFIQDYPGKCAAFCPRCGGECVRGSHCAHLKCLGCSYNFCVHCHSEYVHPNNKLCDICKHYEGVCTPNPLSDSNGFEHEKHMDENFNYGEYATLLGYKNVQDFANKLEAFVNKFKERLIPVQIRRAGAIVKHIRGLSVAHEEFE